MNQEHNEILDSSDLSEVLGQEIDSKIQSSNQEPDDSKEADFCLECIRKEQREGECSTCFNKFTRFVKRQKPSSKYWYSRAG